MKYCSRKCHKAESQKIKMICKRCKKEYFVPPSYAGIRWSCRYAKN